MVGGGTTGRALPTRSPGWRWVVARLRSLRRMGTEVASRFLESVLSDYYEITSTESNFYTRKRAGGVGKSALR